MILKNYFKIAVFMFIFLSPQVVLSNNNVLTRRTILSVAEKTESARYFYGLNNGKFVNCIEQRVSEPSKDDDFWTVLFTIGKMCKVNYDDRLMLRIYINDEGKVMKASPDIKYFSNKYYCQKNKDCVSILDNSKQKCLNFTYSFYDILDNSRDCVCSDSQCLFLAPEKK